MISVREGKVIDLGYYLIAVKEEKRNACTGCYFNDKSCSQIVNCPSSKLIFKKIKYDMKVRCVKEFQTKHMTFKENEEYNAQRVNERWYCVDAVGVSNEDFDKYFKSSVTYATVREAVVQPEEGGLWFTSSKTSNYQTSKEP